MLRRVGLLIVLLTLMIVTTGAVQAAPRLAGPRPTSESGILDRLLGWLSTLLPGAHPTHGGAVKSTWELDGSHLDPNGGEH
jgi:hypothetical protein